MPIVSAHNTTELAQIIQANQYGPSISPDAAEKMGRLVEVASERAVDRMDDGSLAPDDLDHVFTTDWDEKCRETFGSSESGDVSKPNRFMLGVIDEEMSAERDAWLVKEAVAIDQFWLETGDGRRTATVEIDETDTEFHNETGEVWLPKSYIAVFALSHELLLDSPQAAEAM